MVKRYSYKGTSSNLILQDIQGKINILTEENSRENEKASYLQEKIKRYGNLKDIIEALNQQLDLEAITEKLVESAFSFIGQRKGVCVIYLVDSLTQRLKLVKTKKENDRLVIKAKEGDIFDLWVLRHGSPLLIEDIKKDFRFDLEKLRSLDIRPISSLISAPFLAKDRILGILRLDSPEPFSYTQDDLRFLVVLSDLGAVAIENSQLFADMQNLAVHDDLTKLYTKGYFLEKLKQEIKWAIRKDNPVSLLILDIDYFKHYNDKFGHTAGDIVLKELSQNLLMSLKEANSIIGRFGGEEFAVILPNFDKKKALVISEQIRQIIEEMKIILRNQITRITISVGLSTFPEDAKDEDELIIKADQAMYKAKQKGRNRVCTT
ncbi:MAG: sensor domain-containing diguanylate cyclase [Candidatus Omnitrophica bacterium]|nr:sensor domain-containing diguanylate cyclase [Candidatus Omnitrophota bacterium]